MLCPHQKKKRRKVRKTKTMDLDEMEAAAAAEGTSDHGSRAAATNSAKDKTELEKKKRQEGWAKAVEKARDHSASLYGKYPFPVFGADGRKLELWSEFSDQSGNSDYSILFFFRSTI